MKLKQILKKAEIERIYGDTDKEISHISINSNGIKQKSLFIAIKGFNKDGHSFALDAINNGAVALLVQKKLDVPKNITQIVVKNTRKQLALIAANFYNHPSKKMKIIGITGTNGKTTTCFLVNSILKKAKIKSSLITTVQSFISERAVKFDRTTPGPIELNDFFSESLSKGIEFACMEVSSHSIDLHRVDFINFEGFVFTNLTQDHLDYHKNMENYFNAKLKLFIRDYRYLYAGKFAVINIDNNYGKEISNITDLDKITFSVNSGNSDIRAMNIKNSIDGIEFDLIKSKSKIKIKSPLCGYFNVYNILASIGVAIKLDIKFNTIKKGIEDMKGIPGRFEKIANSTGINVIVDYAHTPDGLLNVLKTSKELVKEGGRIITVFGCGGDRDKEKRKMMGSISERFSDYTIITSDNPRSEKPDSIIEMIENGFRKNNDGRYRKITNRKDAIFKAMEMARKKDIVLIAGKGHEDYQEFRNYRIHFSDQETVREWFKDGKNRD